MRKTMLLFALLSATAVGTPAAARKQPQLTPMALQSLQSREYQTTKDQVFSSIVSVFQDLGYQINSADVASGLITAGSANKNKTGFFEAMVGVRSSGGSRVTAFVETMPSGLTRARLNFMNTKNSSSMYGSSSANDTPILEPKTYQVAFEHVEEALFERGALTKTTAPTQALSSAPAQAVAAATSPSAVSAQVVTSPANPKTPLQAAPSQQAPIQPK